MRMLRKIRVLLAILLVSLGMSIGIPGLTSGQTALITFEDVKRISPQARDDLARALADASTEFQAASITTRLRMAHFVAQVMTETGGLKRLDENMNFSYPTLMRVFSRRTISELKARELGNLPIGGDVRARAVANWVYGARLGNRGRDTDDGWNYRGSGFIQLTGRTNFRMRGAEIGQPLEEQPELARQLPEGLLAAIAYWSARDINTAADEHDRLRVRKLVNGPAAHGYEQNKIWFNRAWMRVFRDKEALGFEGAVTLADRIEAVTSEETLFADILESYGLMPKKLPAAESGAAQLSEALLEFQREIGLPETGVLDDITRDALLDPREWRYRGETTVRGVPPVAEPEASIRFELTVDKRTEVNAVVLKADEGSGAIAADPNITPDIMQEIGEASAMYSDYEMGGRSVTPDSWVPYSVVCDEDDDPTNCDTRKAINDTTTFPERAIVQILFDSGFGLNLCSGTMVSPDTVLTAAHCIHSGTTLGRMYSNFRVFPGRNRGALPFGKCRARSAYVLAGWTGSLTATEARYYDLGGLKLDCRVGEATGWLGVAALDSSQVGARIVVHGYAADKAPPGRQWVSEDELRVLWELKGFYKNDTYGGTSGSPVYLASDDSTLVGVHTNGLHGEEPWSSHNAFTRLTPERMQRIADWIKD